MKQRSNYTLKKIIKHFFYLSLLAIPVIGHGQAEFVPNEGQWHENVIYRAEIPGGNLYAENGAFTYQFFNTDELSAMHPGPEKDSAPERLHSHVYKVNFEGAQIPAITGKKEKSHYFNYYIGDEPDNWASRVHPMEQVVYDELYPGVDMLLYSKADRLKYDFKVGPSEDPSQIKLSYEGVENIKLKDGKLIIETSVNRITEHEPFSYQLIEGEMYEVACEYVLDGNELTFSIGEYDSDYELIIDPELTFSSYTGSFADNWGNTATNDSEGNLVAAGTVFGTGYPTTTGAIEEDFNDNTFTTVDIGLSKFSTDGTQLLYSTYFGGGNEEMPHSLICDSQDNIIMMGNTGSADFPITAGSYSPVLSGGPSYIYAIYDQLENPDGIDIFISKLTSDGILDASTFIGGTDTDGMNSHDKLNYNYGDIFRGEVIVDEDDNIIVASTTDSNDFPVTADAVQPTYGGGNCDGVVFKFNPELDDLMWSTYFGGSNDDSGYAVQLDGDNNVFITGGTKSSDLPTSGSAQQGSFGGDVDGYITKYTLAGDLVACTYNGTPNYDQNYLLQLDTEGDVFVMGQTEGDVEIVGDVYSNPSSGQYIQKFNSDLSDLLLSTTIGTGSGAVDISPTAFLVSECNQIYFTGWGGSTNVTNSDYAFLSTTSGLPVTPDAFQGTTDGSDFYLCMLDLDLSELVYATFFGGISAEHVDGGTSKFDKDGTVYQAVCAGCWANDDFPTTPDAWSTVNNSTGCNLGVFKFSLSAVLADITLEGSVGGANEVCSGYQVDFSNSSSGASVYEWDFGDGGNSTEFEPSYVFEEPGVYDVVMVAQDAAGCLDPDTSYITVEVIEGVSPSIEDVDPICEGNSVELQANGTGTLFWLDDPTLSATDIPNPTVTPTEETTYYVVDQNNCGTDTASVTVEFVILEPQITPENTICIGESIQLSISGGDSYQWDSSGSLSNLLIPNPVATPLDTTTYYVTVTTNEGCVAEESVTINVIDDIPGGNVYEGITACANEEVQLEAIYGDEYFWTPSNLVNNPTLQNPTTVLEETTTFAVELSNACGSGIDEVTVEIIKPDIEVAIPDSLCSSASVEVSAFGAVEYLWEPNDFFVNPNAEQTSMTLPQTATITVTGTDEIGCEDVKSFDVLVYDEPFVEAGPQLHLDWPESAYLDGQAQGEFEWQPTSHMENPDDLRPRITPEETTYYTLSVVDEFGCRNIDSVLVEVVHPLYVPNSFTPDGDGLNDFFRAYGENIEEFHMQIFDPWGNIIFESYSIEEPWDGSNKRGDYYVQDGVYNWRITYKTINGKEAQTGIVNIFR